MSRVRDNLFTSVSSGVKPGTPGTISDAENVIISDTEPSTPTSTTIWLDTSNGSNLLKIYDISTSTWIPVSGAWA